MVQLLRSLPRFRYERAKGRFRGYLGTVVHHEVIRHRRRAGDALALAPSDPPADAAVPDLTWEDEWTRHHLRMAMARVRTSSDRRSVEAFEGLLAGASVAEVAAEHGLSVAAVHKVKQRVRDRLREEIARQLRDEELPDASPR